MAFNRGGDMYVARVPLGEDALAAHGIGPQELAALTSLGDGPVDFEDFRKLYLESRGVIVDPSAIPGYTRTHELGPDTRFLPHYPMASVSANPGTDTRLGVSGAILHITLNGNDDSDPEDVGRYSVVYPEWAPGEIMRQLMQAEADKAKKFTGYAKLGSAIAFFVFDPKRPHPFKKFDPNHPDGDWVFVDMLADTDPCPINAGVHLAPDSNAPFDAPRFETNSLLLSERADAYYRTLIDKYKSEGTKAIITAAIVGLNTLFTTDNFDVNAIKLAKNRIHDEQAKFLIDRFLELAEPELWRVPVRAFEGLKEIQEFAKANKNLPKESRDLLRNRSEFLRQEFIQLFAILDGRQQLKRMRREFNVDADEDFELVRWMVSVYGQADMDFYEDLLGREFTDEVVASKVANRENYLRNLIANNVRYLMQSTLGNKIVTHRDMSDDPQQQPHEGTYAYHNGTINGAAPEGSTPSEIFMSLYDGSAPKMPGIIGRHTVSGPRMHSKAGREFLAIDLSQAPGIMFYNLRYELALRAKNDKRKRLAPTIGELLSTLPKPDQQELVFVEHLPDGSSVALARIRPENGILLTSEKNMITEEETAHAMESVVTAAVAPGKTSSKRPVPVKSKRASRTVTATRPFGHYEKVTAGFALSRSGLYLGKTGVGNVDITLMPPAERPLR